MIKIIAIIWGVSAIGVATFILWELLKYKKKKKVRNLTKNNFV